MRRVFGPRTVVEAAFLVAVPVVAAAIGAGMWTIIAASAVAYLSIFALEATVLRDTSKRPGALHMPAGVLHRAADLEAAGEPESGIVRTGPAPKRASEPEPETEPEPKPELEPELVSPLEPEAAPEPEPEPELQPKPEPEPVVFERAPLAVVREPVRVASAPEPEPVPEAAPEPERGAEQGATVVAIGIGAAPRQWNLWDLDRLTRERAGADPARDEERTFLLMYLREFAGPDGMLPVDFDGLVRDSFGELLEGR